MCSLGYGVEFCCDYLYYFLLIIAFGNAQLDFDDGSPPEHAWRRKLSSHANRLKEFNVTFKEAIRMVWKNATFSFPC
jgi:hypothetical protein